MHTTLSTAPNNNSAANFKAWASAISAYLSTTPLVKCTDTGTVNWASNPAVPANGAQTIWEVWRFDDVLQATRPVFMKLVYGSSYGGPGMWVVVGTATDGFGNLSNALTFTVEYYGGGSSSSTSLFATEISAANNRLCFAMWRNWNGLGTGLFNLERSHDKNGADTAEYISGTIMGYQSGIWWGSRTYSYADASWIPGNAWEYIQSMMSVNSSGILNGITPFSPVFPVCGFIGNPNKGLMMVRAADVTEGQSVNINLYGVSTPYIFCKNNNQTNVGYIYNLHFGQPACVGVRAD